MPPDADDPPMPPATEAVNAGWRAEPDVLPAGLHGRFARIVRRLLAPYTAAQVAFNSRQVQLDNALVAWLSARFDAAQRQHDRMASVHGRRMDEIDARHLILQEELVTCVRDLTRRIDLVLSESERGRLSVEFALRDVRLRLSRLEAALQARAAAGGPPA